LETEDYFEKHYKDVLLNTSINKLQVNINMINEDKLNGVDFIKIPHHGSSSASSLLDKISTLYDSNRPITAISTSFYMARQI